MFTIVALAAILFDDILFQIGITSRLDVAPKITVHNFNLNLKRSFDHTVMPAYELKFIANNSPPFQDHFLKGEFVEFAFGYGVHKRQTENFVNEGELSLIDTLALPDLSKLSGI